MESKLDEKRKKSEFSASRYLLILGFNKMTTTGFSLAKVAILPLNFIPKYELQTKNCFTKH